MACSMQSFNNVTAGVWQCLVTKVGKYGVNITTNTGDAESHGVKVHWNYDPASQILQVQAMKTPFFIPCSLVNSKLHDVMDECYANNNVSAGAMIGG